MVTFKITMAALKLALSLIPFTRTTVTSAAMKMAGRSNHVPVKASRPLVGSKSKGAFVTTCGSLTLKKASKSWK